MCLFVIDPKTNFFLFVSSYFIGSVSNRKDLAGVFTEGVVIKKEIYRQRLNQEQKQEVDDEVINKMLVADLLFQQNCNAEKILQSMKEVIFSKLKISMKGINFRVR